MAVTAAFFFLAAAQPALGQSSEPILRIEVGTHNAGIWSIATDPSNQILVTGSEDKTVRVWDVSGRGALMRTLRPPVGEGENGQIFAVAISPDGRTVACGGRTGEPQKIDACVYIFDVSSGTMVRRLGGLPGYIQHLAYTPDHKFLAVITGRGGLRLYRLPDYSLAAQDRDYGDLGKWVEADPSGKRLVTACYDGFIRLYDISALNAPTGSSPQAIAPVSKLRPPGGKHPWGLAFSPDGVRLAVGFHRIPKVDVMEIRNGRLEHAWSPDTSGVGNRPDSDLRAVAWSADGQTLYAAGFFLSKAVYQVRKWVDVGRGEYRDLPLGVDLPVFQLLPLREKGIAYCSRDGSFGLYSHRDEHEAFGPRAIPNYIANREGFLISPDGSQLQFAYERLGKSPAIFAVKERSLTDSFSFLWANLKATFSFQAPVSEGMGVSDWKSTMSPKLNGKPLPVEYDISESLAVLPDRSGFLLGTTLAVWKFDPEGKMVWKVRTPGGVWAVNTNGKLAMATLGDGTIRWYRVSDGKEFLAFFPHPDHKRWVIWTPSGYYDASPGGEDFIGWHVNNGRDQAADFFPNSRFRSMYYRPDVVDLVLSTLDEAEALRLAGEQSGRRPVEPTSVRDKLPPVVAIVSPVDGVETSTASLKVKYSTRSQPPLTRLKVLVDGRPSALEGAGQAPGTSGELLVPIPARNCEVSLIAENRNGASEPATVRLRWKGPARDAFEAKPKLYVLAVGVSAYQDQDMRLGLAAKDALDFGAVWKNQHGRLYSGVEVKALTDAQATKGNILDGLEWLQRQVTAKDIAVLFFAGHGINDATGVFYFLPVDADREKLKRTGISQADITSTVAGLAGKVLVFMDACHSGNLMGKVQRRGVVVTAVVNELASAENGAVVFSSATGRQYALENTE